MRRIEIIRVLRNVGSNGLALAINVLVGVFLSPFILHRLGDTAFGIWVLIFSIAGYYGLFDLGIRSSIVRYVSRARANNDWEDASCVISTSLFSYSCIGIFALLVTATLSLFMGKFHSISPPFQATARWLLIMVGSAVSLGFPLGVFGGVLEALQRFELQSSINIASTLIRALLIVLALTHGYGLLTIAFITVMLPILSSVLRALITFRLIPVRLGPAYVRRSTFRQIANYSGFSFIAIVSGRLRFKSDEIIIGSFLSAAAITYFNIGGRIVDYAEEVVEAFAQILVPMSSDADAKGETERLRKICIAGNRFCSLITFPICSILVILGKSIIEAWVGRRYVAQSYPVLILMAIPSMLMMAQSASGRVLFGTSRHRTWSIVMLGEGVLNIAISILLVRPYGIVGDALGTAIPLTATMIFFQPGHVCRKLQIPLRTYLVEAYALPITLCIPVILTLLLMKMWFVPHTYAQLAVHLLVVTAVYGGLLFWAFATKRALHFEPMQTLEPQP